jgi:two-component system response regulator GlrR
MTSPVILLVDDDQGMMELLSMRLQASNYETLCAGSGFEALHLLDQKLPDLVVTDLRMEKMDGITLFEKIHSHWPSLPVIVLTAHGSIPEAVEATQKGVFSFLTKPVDKDELLTIISSALKHHHEYQTVEDSWEHHIKTRSARMYQVLEQAKLLAESDVNVLIGGESGTGKELMATALHKHSKRAKAPFIALNCSAIPSEMLESELFGHVKGAFTGATRDHQGLIAAADGGVLFLDEIGDMPLALQAKLLRVLQEKRVRPVGGTQDVQVDIRVFSATHRDLLKAIANNEFREDLYYRLNVVSINLPSLRERKEDIVFLANHFLKAIAEREGASTKQLAPQAVSRLLSYSWPGNVRQLENVMEQVAALCRGPVISETLIDNALPDQSQKSIPPLSDAKKEFEHDYVTELLRTTQGNMAMAAKLAGRNRSDFYKIVSRHKLDVNVFKQQTPSH